VIAVENRSRAFAAIFWNQLNLGLHGSDRLI
jgi:hypothetical protein